MTSKERAGLKSQAVNIEPVLQIGKSGITPELTEAVRETFHTRELTKIHILQSCTEEGRVLGQTLADRTGSEVVQVIGRMIILYKKNDELHQKNTVKDPSKNDHPVKDKSRVSNKRLTVTKAKQAAEYKKGKKVILTKEKAENISAAKGRKRHDN